MSGLKKKKYITRIPIKQPASIQSKPMSGFFVSVAHGSMCQTYKPRVTWLNTVSITTRADPYKGI